MGPSGGAGKVFGGEYGIYIDRVGGRLGTPLLTN
jgi:hypothetical protein